MYPHGTQMLKDEGTPIPNNFPVKQRGFYCHKTAQQKDLLHSCRFTNVHPWQRLRVCQLDMDLAPDK
jgi:hypothetical protein